MYLEQKSTILRQSDHFENGICKNIVYSSWAIVWYDK